MDINLKIGLERTSFASRLQPIDRATHFPTTHDNSCCACASRVKNGSKIKITVGTKSYMTLVLFQSYLHFGQQEQRIPLTISGKRFAYALLSLKV